MTFCSSLAFAQGFRRPDPARPVGRPAAPPRDARPVDIFAGIRNAENTALGLQREIQDLKQRIHECVDREMERITQEQQAREELARNPRGLFGRAIDFFKGRRGPERPRAAAPAPSPCEPLVTEIEGKRARLREMESRIAVSYRDLYTRHRGQSRTVASIGLHEFATCLRQEAFPTQTIIPDLERCEGGIVEDQILFNYADHYAAGRYDRMVESLTRYENQLQCQSELQALLFNYNMDRCLDRVASKPELQGAHRCEFLGGLFHPVMNATDVVLYMNPPTFEWVEEHRREMISCLPGSKLATLGFWFYDYKTGEMKQFPPCTTSPASDSPSCAWGGDFIWSMNKENMGWGECSLYDLAVSEPIPERGFVCDGKICREALPVLIAERRAEELARRIPPADGTPDGGDVPEGIDTPEVTPTTPFGVDIEMLKAELCIRDHPSASPILPNGCGVNVLPGYSPRYLEQIFQCPEAERSGSYAGLRTSPACQVSTGTAGGCDPVTDSNCPVDATDPDGGGGGGGGGDDDDEDDGGGGGGGGGRSESNREPGPAHEREPADVSLQRFTEIRGEQINNMRRPGSIWRLRGWELSMGLGYGEPPESAYQAALNVLANARYIPGGGSLLYCGTPTSLGCQGSYLASREHLFLAGFFIDTGYDRERTLMWETGSAVAVSWIKILVCEVGNISSCRETMMHEALHALAEYMRTRYVYDQVVTRHGGVDDGLFLERNDRYSPTPSDELLLMDEMELIRAFPSFAQSGGNTFHDPEHLIIYEGDPRLPARSCGVDDCSLSCTPGMERIIDAYKCISNPRGTPGGAGGPDDVGWCGPGVDPAECNRVMARQPLDAGCFNLGLIGNVSPQCAAVQCPEGQYNAMGAGGNCCRTPGTRSGGGGSGNRGPIDRGWCGPGGDCPDRGGGGGGSGGNGGLPGGTPSIDIPGGPGGPAEAPH